MAKATGKYMWDGTKVVIQDILEVSAEVVGLAPIPGLQEAVSSVLKIWSFVQEVEVRPVCKLVSDKV